MYNYPRYTANIKKTATLHNQIKKPLELRLDSPHAHTDPGRSPPPDSKLFWRDHNQGITPPNIVQGSF